MDNRKKLKYDIELGEGQYIEFKELPDKSLPKEMVAFANASGGIIYLGISDTGIVKGINTKYI
jgi:ATP-dependent DNA helicase RecG